LALARHNYAGCRLAAGAIMSIAHTSNTSVYNIASCDLFSLEFCLHFCHHFCH